MTKKEIQNKYLEMLEEEVQNERINQWLQKNDLKIEDIKKIFDICLEYKIK
jgi:hypothetical protein